MSAKQTKVQIDWKQESNQGQDIPINSRLAKDNAEFYPFAFVSSEEFYLGQGEREME